MNLNRLKKIVYDDRLIIAALFLFSLLSRYFLRADCFFHVDGMSYAIAAQETFHSGALHYTLNTGYPAVVLIISIFYGIHHLLTGTLSAEPATIFSMLFMGALTIPIMYLFVKEWLDSRAVAFASALFYSVTPIFFSATTFGKDHGASACFIALAAYLVLLSGRKDSNLYRALSGVAFGLSLGVRVTNAAFALPIVMLYLHNSKIDFSSKSLFRAAKELSIVFLPALAIFAVLYYGIISSSGLTQFTGLFAYHKMFGIVYTNALILALAWITKTLVYYGWFFLFVGLAWMVLRKRYLVLLTLLAWFFVFFAPLMNSAGLSSRYLTEAIMPLMIICGISFNFFSEIKIKNRKLKFASVAFLIFIFSFSMFELSYALTSFRHSYCGPKEYYSWVGSNIGPEGVLLAQDECAFAGYYGNITVCLGHPVLGKYNDQSAWRDMMFRIDSYLDGGTSVYVTDDFYTYDAMPGNSGTARDFIETNYNTTNIGSKLTENYHGATIHHTKQIHNLNLLSKKESEFRSRLQE